MGRPSIEVTERDSVEALKKAYVSCTSAVESRRIQAIWLLRQGKHRAEVREITGFHNGPLVEIIKRYNAAGLAGLVDRRLGRSGRKPLLSDGEMLQMAQCIRKDYAVGIYWNGQKVVRWIREELGYEVHEQRAYEYLKAIGMSLQRPRPRHCKADLAAQERFKKNTA
jgi:transposase